MKSLIPFLILSVPAAAQHPIDASNPGQPIKQLHTNVATLGSPTAASDDFNRPDSASMGPSWNEQSGDLNIASNAGHGTANVSWMTHNILAAEYATSVTTIDFLPQAVNVGVIYVAATIGGSGDAIFVKVQDNTSDGIYDRVFFYRGVNGTAWATNYFFDLAVPTASGTMRVSFSPDGDTVTLDIDRDMDGTYDETFSVAGVVAAFGAVTPTHGISTYQDPTFDNWSVNGGVSNSGSGYCFGDGTGAPCPCAGLGGPGEGCVNTGGTGATLVGSGNAIIGSDTFQLDLSGVPGIKPCLILKGDNQITSLIGDGILCTTGNSLRSQVQLTAAGATTFSDWNGGTFGSISNVGAPTNFQAWYRDPTNPCSGAGFNFSNAWTVTY